MRLPNKLPGSFGLSEDSGSVYTRMGVAYNYAIGGEPFLSAASRQDPIIRETAPVRKEQIDDQALPGEQTLDYWWLRSQHSFHGGAGQIFADPSEDNPLNAIRFRQSVNINPWDQGEVKLLNGLLPLNFTGVLDATEMVDVFNETNTVAALTDSQIIWAEIDNENEVVAIIPYTPESSGTPITNLKTITSDGLEIFLATNEGVYSQLATVAPGDFLKIYDIPDTPQSVHMAFVKSRLILAADNSIYELDPSPDTPPAALPAPIFSYNNPNWRWTGITETGRAIYVMGNNGLGGLGGRGAILKLVLDESGDIPTLTAPAIACQLPSAEVPYSAMGYLGRFIGIGTNRGVRVGISEDNGDISYGPVLFETDAPVCAWSGRDRFLFCTTTRANEGNSGIYRIDLSTEVAPLRFAYSSDLTANREASAFYNSPADQVDDDATDCVVTAHLGGSDFKFFATEQNSYVEYPWGLARSGHLQTSRIRFNTLEPKLYKYFRVRGPILDGTLGVQTLDQDDNLASSHSFAPGRSPGGNDIGIASPSGPTDFMSLRFTFNGTTETPVALALDDTADSYASTPDSAALDITGDIELEIELAPDDWTPAAEQTLISKWDTTGQRSYKFSLLTDGTLRLEWSEDGTAVLSATSTAPVTDVKTAGRLSLRARFDVDNGSSEREVSFWTSASIDRFYQPLGETVTQAGATSIHAGTANLEIGSFDGGTTERLTGYVHAAQVTDGLGGTVVANPYFTAQTLGATSFTDAAGNTWTVHAGAAIAEDTDSTTTPTGAEMNAYQVKALPATPRQRIIQLPLWCFDWETDRHGQRRGGQGEARRRLRALEEVERAGDTVILQDFDVGENYECVIERLSFRQVSPPTGYDGWGGMITATLRTVR